MGDWTELPGELLCLVFDSLGWVDCVRFAAVCVPWRQAVAGRRHHPPLRPQPPCLMAVLCTGAEPTAADFFCLAGRTTYRVELPKSPVRHRMLIGSSGGWLVTADEVSEMHMLNPITGVQVRLPSILTLPIVDAVRDADGRLTGYLLQDDPWEECAPQPLGLEVTGKMLYQKVVLSHSSASASDWTAVLMCYPGCSLAFARAGDRAWTFLRLREYFVTDVIFHKGRVYAVDGGTVTAWDLSGPSPSLRATYFGPLSFRWSSRDTATRWHLVESGGDLLQVWRELDEDEDEDEDERFILTTLRFVVFRLDESKQQWVHVKSLEQRALFLGVNDSMSLSTLEFPELKRNAIYFTEDFWDLFVTQRRSNGEPAKRDIGVFSLENESIERCCLYDNYPSWLPPAWIMLRLH